MVESVVELLSIRAHSKGIDLPSHISIDVPTKVRGDAGRIRQILINLVSNAIKFTDKGSVEIDVAADDGAFKISVKDTGPGVAPADQKRIFEQFQQVDSSSTRKKGGTGLGLSISRQLVDMHGGRIDLDSTPGVGSTFTIVVPIRVTEQRQPA